MNISSRRAALIDRARSMQEFILQQIPSQIPRTDKTEMVSGLFYIVLEHHRSILLLLETGTNTGSAFALARPLIEAAYRAHWIWACATPKQLAAARTRGKDPYPDVNRIAGMVDAKVPTKGLFSIVREYMPILHGFTHGGLEHISRRFDDQGDLRASFSEEEIEEIVQAMTSHVVILAIVFCQLTSDRSDQEDPRCQGITECYIEKFGATP